MAMQTSVLQVSCSITQYLKHSVGSVIIDHSHLLDASIFANEYLLYIFVVFHEYLICLCLLFPSVL